MFSSQVMMSLLTDSCHFYANNDWPDIVRCETVTDGKNTYRYFAVTVVCKNTSVNKRMNDICL